MISFFLFRHAIKAIYGRRFDGAPSLPYARAKDFGIEEKRFSFETDKHHILYGSKYFKKGVKPKALVVFFHGLGDGRASYVRSICQLANEGYLVYAYDNTGCMESEGNKIISLEHTIIDQEYFFKYLEEDPDSKGLKRYSVGHSWGGYGAAMSAKPEYKIEKIVDIAGFNDPLRLVSEKLPKWCHIFKPSIWLDLKCFTGKEGAQKTYQILQNSTAKVLYIQGDKDKDVTPGEGYEPLYALFKENKRFQFLYIPNRGHSVYKSKDAEEYVQKIMKEGITSLKSTKDVEMDLIRATNPNKEIWDKIFIFLAETNIDKEEER